jgi:DNA-binding MarR family transcriptional regulator
VNPSDTELQLLETIYSKQSDTEALSQRDLAGAAGLSLGMTNALLRRFVERGWVKFMHLSGRSLHYILTSDGMEEVLHRSLSYFTRAVRSASLYRDKIDTYVIEISKAGFSALVLEGPAELDFLFDYSCERHGLEFVKNPPAARRRDLLSRKSVMFVKAKAFEKLEEEGCEGTDEAAAGIDAEAASGFAGSPEAIASVSLLANILFGCADTGKPGGT